VFVACIVGYALSPIDLIPDFIPVLGYLDDVILIPLGVTLALKIIPKPLLEQCRKEASERLCKNGPRNWLAAGIIVAIWLIILLVVIFIVLRAVRE
jgi:uncharacterized membrane protein YkvA (DUF1232 family)